MRNLILTTLSLLLLCSSFALAQSRNIDLSGEWDFGIDSLDVGESQKWYAKEFAEKVYLPGSMAENRKGNDVTLKTQWTASIYDDSFLYNPRLEKYRQPNNLKLPFWLTPVKYYVGAAWYQKIITIPADWRGQKIVLFLERPHTETRLWINGQEVGMQNSLSVPHIYEVDQYLSKGANRITLRIDNRTKEIDVGKDSHSITDQTQGNWNGVVGRLELQSMPQCYIDDIRIYPDLKSKTARIQIDVVGKGSGAITLNAKSYNGAKTDEIPALSIPFSTKNEATSVETVLDMGDGVLLWDEFNPNLYKLTATLETKYGTDIKQTRFGMREFTIEGKYFYINGRKIMLRGTVENCVFPLTGYAPMDVESWLRVFETCKKFGLNHMRFHSYCPPEAAMEAADLTGFYLQPEGPTWPNHGSSLGDGRPVDDYLWEEAKQILKRYGNYPSFCMFAIGNEPRGRWVAWVSKFVDYWKETDTRRVYTGASVGGSWAWQPRNQFHVKAGARGLDWGRLPETNSDFSSKIDTVSQPFVSHETGQWNVFPDFKEIRKYTGVMRARNFELFREDLTDRNMGEMGEDFLMASGKLQALCYKHEIERTLRTPGYAGFQLLSLNDYSGQGTALVGVLNAFWEEKGYINAWEFRKFCAPTVLLVRMDKFVYKSDQIMKATVEISHFGENPLSKLPVSWSVRDEYGKIVTQGELPARDIAIGNCQQLGSIEYSLRSVEKATKLNLELSCQSLGISNDWDFWVYPAMLPQQEIENIHVTDKIDIETERVLKNGGKVLLLLAGKVTKGSDVVQHMTPSFWNTSWFKMRPPHTEGTLVNSFHPILQDFPTDYYTGLQWWEVVNRGQVMELNNFPAEFQPIVQPIDTWFINRKLGTLFEATIGRGKVVVCSMDIQTDLENRFVARQMYYSIVNYMNSHLFFPENQLTLSVIKELVQSDGESIDIKTKDAPDELKNIVL